MNSSVVNLQPACCVSPTSRSNCSCLSDLSLSESTVENHSVNPVSFLRAKETNGERRLLHSLQPSLLERLSRLREMLSNIIVKSCYCVCF